MDSTSINTIINSITQIPYLIVKYCYYAFRFVVSPIPNIVWTIIYILIIALAAIMVIWFIRHRNDWMKVKP